MPYESGPYIPRCGYNSLRYLCAIERSYIYIHKIYVYVLYMYISIIKDLVHVTSWLYNIALNWNVVCIYFPTKSPGGKLNGSKPVTNNDLLINTITLQGPGRLLVVDFRVQNP